MPSVSELRCHRDYERREGTHYCIASGRLKKLDWNKRSNNDDDVPRSSAALAAWSGAIVAMASVRASLGDRGSRVRGPGCRRSRSKNLGERPADL